MYTIDQPQYVNPRWRFGALNPRTRRAYRLPASICPPKLNLDSPGILLVRDDECNLTHIEHIRKPVGLGRQLNYPPSSDDLKELAQSYLNSVKGPQGYNITDYKVDLDAPGLPYGSNSDKTVLRLAEIKSLGRDTVLTIAQSFARIEVWQAGLSLSIYHAPFHVGSVVTSSQSTLHLHRGLEDDSGLKLPVLEDRFVPGKIDTSLLAQALGIDLAFIQGITSKRLVIYKYIPDEREDSASNFQQPPLVNYTPRNLFPLRPVPGNIRANRHRTVTEVLFTSAMPGPIADSVEMESTPTRTLNWRVFLDIETGAILYLRAFASGCLDTIFPEPDAPAHGVGALGRVLRIDPMTATGNDPFNMPARSSVDAALTARTSHVHLPDIIDNPGAWQFLAGEYIQINTKDTPPFDPNPRAGISAGHTPDFTQNIVAHPVDFTAVNAYYHCTMMFRLMEKLGFEDVVHNYFRHATSFPITIDPQGTDGELNALVLGNASSNGVSEILFGPMQPGASQLGLGVGNASDVRVVLHEFCHALMYAQVQSPNFGFAHSAGDSLGAILCDPASHLRTDPVLRFETFPWIASANPHLGKIRYHGGAVDGRNNMGIWGWRGTQYFADTNGYLREQILSMTLFHLYRVLGGDSADLARRCLAALYTVYLVIKAISLFSSASNLSTTNATILATHMIEADSREGKPKGEPFGEIRGGGVHKVVRWAFEKHGLYPFSPVPAASGENVPAPGEGAPPKVDIYINDMDSSGNGRRGEYSPVSDFTTTEIWNRTGPTPGAGPADHQEPGASGENHIFVRIRNRGYAPANDVSVKAYFVRQPDQGEPLWDGEVAAGGSWNAMAGEAATTTGLSVQRGGEVTAGPFRWNPGADSAGTEVCVLVSVSDPGDPSNLDPNPMSMALPFSVVPMPLWWLVPFDNNIGQRKLTVMP